jgi:hypothetical protein
MPSQPLHSPTEQNATISPPCSRAKPRTETAAIITITTVLIVSRLIWVLEGGYFQVPFYWHQFLSSVLLSSRLLQSIFYLHSQPPLLDLSAGIGLKLFPHSYLTVFAMIFACIGLAMAITLYLLMIDLGVPSGISLIATVAFEASPATILFENFFYDTYPTAAILCIAAFCLNRFLKHGTRLYGIAFAVALGVPVFLNRTFQLPWFIGIGAILCFFAYGRMRRILPAGLIVLGLILLLYLKNFLVFGTFWTGTSMGISFITTWQIPEQERAELVREGKLSPLALAPVYPTVHVPESARTGIPALDEETKPDWPDVGAPNLNNLAFIQISRQQVRDAIWVVVHRPGAYARGVWRSIKYYFEPASEDLPYLKREYIEKWCELYEWFLFPPGLPKLSIDPREDLRPYNPIKGAPPSTVLLLIVPALALYALMITWRAWLARGLSEAGDVTMLFITLNIFYLTVLGVGVAFGENNRYRYLLDPFYVVLLGVFLARARLWLAARYELLARRRAARYRGLADRL